MRTDEEYRSLSADLFSGVGFPLFCNGRLWHNGVSCCFVMKELAVTNFCFFATGGCAVTVYFCCLASGSFSVQIFLAVLPGDIYLWVFLFRNKRFFATTFSVYNGRFLPPRFLTVLSGRCFRLSCKGGFVVKFFYFFATIFSCFVTKRFFATSFFSCQRAFPDRLLHRFRPLFPYSLRVWLKSRKFL